MRHRTPKIHSAHTSPNTRGASPPREYIVVRYKRQRNPKIKSNARELYRITIYVSRARATPLGWPTRGHGRRAKRGPSWSDALRAPAADFPDRRSALAPGRTGWRSRRRLPGWHTIAARTWCWSPLAINRRKFIRPTHRLATDAIRAPRRAASDTVIAAARPDRKTVSARKSRTMGAEK